MHEPIFIGNENKYINECIESTFVSSAGKYVEQFEEKIAAYIGAKCAVKTSNACLNASVCNFCTVANCNCV